MASDHHHNDNGNRPKKSRVWTAFMVFAAIAGFMLIYEHRAHLFGGNSLLYVLLAACIGVHLFMHGGHGGHGGKSDQGNNRESGK